MHYKTAESVSPKHPDKLCDRVSDAILDAVLEDDARARVAVDVAGGHGKLFITGEITTTAQVDYTQVARTIVGNKIDITEHIAEQSPEIAQGVDTGGAGDQGIMVGYATAETDSLIPLETELSRSLNRVLFREYDSDGKTQVTIRDGRVESIVASFQNARADDIKTLVKKWLKQYEHAKHVVIHANPAGDWHQGGFDADAGLTGRKIAVDNYGPRIPIGGGCFSGKDASKVDRSAAYMARRISVDYVRKHKAQEVYCYLAYAIGVAEPLQATVIVDGEEQSITDYDLTPAGISAYLKLNKPQYLRTAGYGHFGNGFAWDI